MRSTHFGFWSPAIRRVSHSLLRSSSTCEPSDPLSGVVFFNSTLSQGFLDSFFGTVCPQGASDTGLEAKHIP